MSTAFFAMSFGSFLSELWVAGSFAWQGRQFCGRQRMRAFLLNAQTPFMFALPAVEM